MDCSKCFESFDYFSFKKFKKTVSKHFEFFAEIFGFDFFSSLSIAEKVLDILLSQTNVTLHFLSHFRIRN